MQIVIDIPKEYYDCLQELSDDKCLLDTLLLKHGIVLPEHHGRLIDSTIIENKIRIAKLVDEVTDEMIVGLSVALDFCLDAPTVLPSSDTDYSVDNQGNVWVKESDKE